MKYSDKTITKLQLLPGIEPYPQRQESVPLITAPISLTHYSILTFTEQICGLTRLGNKMFRIAATIAATVTHHTKFVMIQPEPDCPWMSDLQSLFISLKETTPLIPSKWMNSWEGISEAGFSLFTRIIPTNVNATVFGYRQSWKYFITPSEKQAVRDIFKFTSKYESYAHNVLTTASNNTSPILVGVHMRIGDLLYEQSVNFGYQPANKTFYDKVLKKVTSNLNNSNNIVFVASSDSPKLAKQMLNDAEAKYKIFWLNGTAFEDFATLSKCNHSIISGGTYGFWTAWLAGGKTFYFENFAKRGSYFDRGFLPGNFYLPDWIGIS